MLKPPYEYFLRQDTWTLDEACLLVCRIFFSRDKPPSMYDYFPKDSEQTKLRKLAIDAIHNGRLEAINHNVTYFLPGENYSVFPERFILWAKEHMDNIPDVLLKQKSFGGIGSCSLHLAASLDGSLINKGIPPTEDEIWLREEERKGNNPLVSLLLRDMGDIADTVPEGESPEPETQIERQEKTLTKHATLPLKSRKGPKVDRERQKKDMRIFQARQKGTTIDELATGYNCTRGEVSKAIDRARHQAKRLEH